MRGRRATIAAATALVLLPMAAARAGSVTFTDPDDFEVAPDVHRTTRTTYLADDVRRVRIGVRGELGPDYRLRVLLDTRGDRAADVVMVATVRNLELVSCLVRNVEGGAIRARCAADPFRAWWNVRRRDLAVDGGIRWRVVAFGGPALTEVTDRAPDAGWYG